MKRILVQCFIFSFFFLLFLVIGITNLSKKNQDKENENENNNIFQQQSRHFSSLSFLQQKYECIGSCFCDEERSSSSSTAFFPRSLRYLITASTSIIAYKSAKTYFENECIENYSSDCHLKSIKSEVEDCSISKTSSTENKEKASSKGDEEESSESITYLCYGNCVEKQIKKTSKVRFKEKMISISCKKIKAEVEVIVHKSDLIAKTGYKSYMFHRTAKWKFVKFHLVDLCKENSKMDVYYMYESNNFRKSYYKKSVCVGTTRKNSNVKCKQIHPSSKKHFQEKEWWIEKEEWKKS